MDKKLKIGMYTFTCCEDSTIMFTVLLDDYFSAWSKRIVFVEARILRKARSDESLDVAFVEGAITSDDQIPKLQKIRSRAAKLIAMGSCACTGMPSALRNDFDETRKQEIEFILDRFRYAEKVRKIADIVKIDGMIPGCPMNSKIFLETLNNLFIEFGIAPFEIKQKHLK